MPLSRDLSSHASVGRPASDMVVVVLELERRGRCDVYTGDEASHRVSNKRSGAHRVNALIAITLEGAVIGRSVS